MLNSSPMESNAEPRQPWETMVLPYVLGELSPAERKAFEAMLETNELCKVRLYETQRLVQELRSLPQETVSRDLSAEIMARISDEAENETRQSQPASFHWSAAFKWAAGFAILAGGLLLTTRIYWSRNETATVVPVSPSAEANRAVAKALRWLADAQEPSGAWDGARWGGNRQYTIGLTGLALLALATDGPAHNRHAYADEIDRAVDYLIRHQRSNGVIGRHRGGMRYDHALATCALLEVYKSRPSPELKHVLDHALQHLATGTGIPADKALQPQATPEKIWAFLALKRAGDLGWTADASVDQTWEGATLLSSNTIEERALGEIDFYQGYLLSTALALDNRRDVHPLLVSLQSRLISAQRREGPLAGSWDLSDRFSSAGGRVYTTSLAALTLRLGSASNGRETHELKQDPWT